MNRRSFLKLGAGAAAGAAIIRPNLAAFTPEPSRGPFRISLAEWSLNQSIRSGKMTHLDFPKIARRELGIDCVELVDQFFEDKSKDQAYLKEFRSRASGEGVRIHLIMLDTNGRLGAASKAERDKAVEKTIPWLDAAKFFGCRTVRVNAWGEGNADELREHVAESCAKLADMAAERRLNLAIENHGELSSDANWLVSLMNKVNKPNFGTLPDFGNFPDSTNRYDAVEAMMPFAKAVSAKASGFTDAGMVKETDFFRMMRIVRDGGYYEYVGIETEVEGAEKELDAARTTRDLLKWIHEEENRCKPIFNGRDIAGDWDVIEGGDWKVENGVLVGSKGQNWSTNPEKTGSWLSTHRDYRDFRLELQYMINEGGNSGVFFRSARQKNPAFTGYEMQILDRPGVPPIKGSGAIYDVLAPSKQAARPSGQWNTVTILAQDKQVRVEMNGEKIIDAELPRSMRGYIGLQNHDDKSEVRFRNIRIEEITA